MTDPRPVDMLLRGYGVDDVRAKTGLSWPDIALSIIMSPHQDALRPHLRLLSYRKANEDRGAA